LDWRNNDTSLGEFALLVEKKLCRSPQVFGNLKSSIGRVAWCTGGAQKYFQDAINLDVDLFITGEISEQIPAMAKESGVSFMSAGHHATERYGVQALCQFLAEKFNLEHEYVEIPNDV
jgi:putative NIF3 family GTP cyclohydrolase 1 type 2